VLISIYFPHRFVKDEIIFKYRGLNVCNYYINVEPIPAAMRYKTQVCGSSITGIAVWNTAEGMDDRLLCLLCVMQVAASGRTDNLFRGVIVCVCVCV
jgi:hypothetical protein